MTMQGMVDYLESKGFWVRKKYNSEKHVYEFTISKDDKHLYREFPYPAVSGRLRNSLQEDFLDKMLADFDKGSNPKPKDQLDAIETMHDLREFAIKNGYAINIEERYNEPTKITVEKCPNSITRAMDGQIRFCSEDKQVAFLKGMIRSVDPTLNPMAEHVKCPDYVDTDIAMTRRASEMMQKGLEEGLVVHQDNSIVKAVTKQIINSVYGSGLRIDKNSFRMGDIEFIKGENGNMMFKYVGNKNCEIKKVHFNDPMTIVIWSDGTKTIVKAKNEEFDPEKGLAMAIAKKAMGNKYNYIKEFEKWIPKPVEEPKPIGKVTSVTEKDGGVTATVELTDLLDF